MSNDSDLIARAERAALDLASTGRNDADAELLNELAKALKSRAGAECVREEWRAANHCEATSWQIGKPNAELIEIYREGGFTIETRRLCVMRDE